MTRIATVLTEGFADWETALLNAAGRTYYGIETLFVTPDGKPVTSSGGMQVSPTMAMGDLDLDSLDALVFCGGTIWSSPNAPDIAPLAQAARSKGIVVAGICDATKALARAGVLDAVTHTSNSADNLTDTGYAGAGLYRDQPNAVSDQKVVTAPGTAPVSFTVEVLRALGLGDANLDFYAGMHGAEHRAAA